MTGPAVTLLQAPITTGAYGDDEPDWTNATQTALVGAAIAPEFNEENNEIGRRGVVIGWTLYFVDSSVTVSAHDRVSYDGHTYEVEGHPAAFHHYRTGRNVLQVPLRRVEG